MKNRSIGQAPPGPVAGGPVDAGRVGGRGGDEHLVLAVLEVEERCGTRHRCAGQGGVAVRVETACGGAVDAGEHQVDAGAVPSADSAVAGVVLRLTGLAGQRVAAAHGAGDPAVRDLGAEGERATHPGQVEVAGDVHPTQRGSLGDRPAHGVRRLPDLVRVDREVAQRAPEVVKRARAERARLGVDVKGAVDDDVLRRGAQARDRGVVAHCRADGIGRAAIGAGPEQHQVSAGAELFLACDALEVGVDLGDRRLRPEDLHVGSEVVGAAVPHAHGLRADRVRACCRTGSAVARSRCLRWQHAGEHQGADRPGQSDGEPGLPSHCCLPHH